MSNHLNDTNPTVFLIDDDFAVRDAICMLLETTGMTVESYASGRAFLQAYDHTRRGCLVLDVRMPGMDGLELQKVLAAKEIDLPIIFISGHGDVPMSAKAFRAGAIDFIEKPFDDHVLLNRIEEALAVDAKATREKRRKGEFIERYGRLTPREKEVMKLVIEGHSSKEIGKILGISHRTIDTHRSRVMEKMQADSVTDLVSIAFECELK